jgi:hypothetical protein
MKKHHKSCTTHRIPIFFFIILNLHIHSGYTKRKDSALPNLVLFTLISGVGVAKKKEKL